MATFEICRMCLTSNVRMHRMDSLRLQDMFENVTRIKLNTDERPDTICYICLPQLQKCHRFLEMCQTAEETLEYLIQSGIEVGDSLQNFSLTRSGTSFITIDNIPTTESSQDTKSEVVNEVKEESFLDSLVKTEKIEKTDIDEQCIKKEERNEETESKVEWQGRPGCYVVPVEHQPSLWCVPVNELTEARGIMAADLGHDKRWLGRGRALKAQEYPFLVPLTPGDVSVHDLKPSIAESMPSIYSAQAGIRPSTSGVTRGLVIYDSDLDSEFDDEFDDDSDDEFDENSLEITAVETGSCRDIPDDEELEEPVREVINSIERAMDDEADRMTGTSSSFTWQEDFDTFRGIPEFFSGDSLGPIKDYDTPYDSFIEIWDEEIIEHIAQETNRYAKQTIDRLKAKRELKPTSSLHKWEPTDADEILVLYAVIMYMGIDPRTSLIEYWQSNFVDMPKFKQIMTYERYLLMNKFLHFVDNNCIRNEEGLSPKLVKLGPVIRHLNSKFSTLYYLAREISIDESLTSFKGRLSWIQAMRTKTARFCIKSFELCESSTGYMYKFEIYTGKNSASFTDAPSTDLDGKSTLLVILDLLKGLENRGHCVTMDNYYNCPALARYLKSLGFDCLGTLRKNRRHVPNDIAEISKNVAKDTMVARHCGDVSVVAWKDSKLVTIISTYHNDGTYVGSRAGKVVMKPVSVRDYKNTIEGVDLKYQKLSLYQSERKKGLKWYVQMFKRLLNVTIHNAFVMYVSSLRRQNKPTPTLREFRYSLAKSLVVQHHECPPEVFKHVGGLRLRKDVVHVPKYDFGNKYRLYCVVCNRQKIKRLVYSQCDTCGVFVCFNVCWMEWHGSVNLKGQECTRKRRFEV